MPPHLGRRMLLKGAAASLLAPTVTWAAAGSPAYLAACKDGADRFSLVGLGLDGAETFRLSAPGRGHAAAAHPHHPEAVAFARRPGDFALVIDCAKGRESARLSAPKGRRFYGHGAFSADGGLLYTSENAFEEGEGRIGVWDARADYRRIGEFSSGGVGPHDVALAADGARLVVANGGIQTHPDSGRAKLNLPTMRPNLAYLSARSGKLLQTLAPPEKLRMHSIRHLALRADGLVAAAMQWQGAPLQNPPLLALHVPGEAALRFAAAPTDLQRRTRNYAGSVAFSGDGAHVAYTAPRGGLCMIFDDAGAFAGAAEAIDICGVAAAADGFRATSGEGRVFAIGANARLTPLSSMPIAYDNHLIRL
ncbi:MAG: DUF1513 domain-containing protein [Neomegalonema sp.]|nr:DUF1513 domain-containing protein [Neomegalonema sp.]